MRDVVSLNFASWNRIAGWLGKLQRAAQLGEIETARDCISCSQS